MTEQEIEEFIFESQLAYIKGELSEDQIKQLNDVSKDILSDEVIEEVKKTQRMTEEEYTLMMMNVENRFIFESQLAYTTGKISIGQIKKLNDISKDILSDSSMNNFKLEQKRIVAILKDFMNKYNFNDKECQLAFKAVPNSNKIILDATQEEDWIYLIEKASNILDKKIKITIEELMLILDIEDTDNFMNMERFEEKLIFVCDNYDISSKVLGNLYNIVIERGNKLEKQNDYIVCHHGEIIYELYPKVFLNTTDDTYMLEEIKASNDTGSLIEMFEINPVTFEHTLRDRINENYEPIDELDLCFNENQKNIFYFFKDYEGFSHKELPQEELLGIFFDIYKDNKNLACFLAYGSDITNKLWSDLSQFGEEYFKSEQEIEPSECIDLVIKALQLKRREYLISKKQKELNQEETVSKSPTR